jgi:hypothetical protein
MPYSFYFQFGCEHIKAYYQFKLRYFIIQWSWSFLFYLLDADKIQKQRNSGKERLKDITQFPRNLRNNINQLSTDQLRKKKWIYKDQKRKFKAHFLGVAPEESFS